MLTQNDYDRIVDFLEACYRGIDQAYKEKYKLTIWEQFENRVRAASYSGTLLGMFQQLKRHMPIHIKDAHLSATERLLKTENAQDVLTALRQETAYLVVLVRNRVSQGRSYDKQL